MCERAGLPARTPSLAGAHAATQFTLIAEYADATAATSAELAP
jgi:hypothetical protein